MQAWIRPCLPERQTCTSTVSFDSQNASLPFLVPSGSLRVLAFVHSEVIPPSKAVEVFPRNAGYAGFGRLCWAGPSEVFPFMPT